MFKSFFVKLLVLCATAGITNALETCQSMKLSAAHGDAVLNALPEAWPWIVAVFDSAKNEYLFSGSLISKEHVLIAAHNVLNEDQRNVTPASDLSVWIGKYNLEAEADGAVLLNVSDVIVHPDWNPELNNWEADIAILSLELVIDFNIKTQPISVLKFNEKDDITNEDGFVVGWNLNREATNVTDLKNLKQATMQKVLDCPCSEKQEIVGNLSFSHVLYTGDGFFVTEKNWALGGVLLSTHYLDIESDKCKSINTIFVKVAPFEKWITETINATSYEFKILKFHFATPDILGTRLEYRASAVNWDISNQKVKLQTASGEHEKGKSNDNVMELELKHQDKMLYLPLNLGKTFKHIRRISGNLNALKMVTKEAFTNMEQLEELFLQDNKIEELVEAAFSPLTNLKYLRLSRNAIKDIHVKAFKNLANLKFLRMVQNVIEMLPEHVFDDLKSLEYLDISYNKIKVLPARLFDNLKKLDEFNASVNDLRSINIDFMNVTSLNRIILKGNVCLDDSYGFGSFNWIWFGSKQYLRNLERDVEENCKFNDSLVLDDY